VSAPRGRLTDVGDFFDDARARLLLSGPRGRELCVHVARMLDDDVAEAWTLDAGYDTNPVFGRRLAAALQQVDLVAVSALDDPLRLIRPLMDSIVSAMYWQPPWTHEAVIGSDLVVAALEPVAGALVRAPAVSWWDFGVDRYAQRVVHWIYERGGLDPGEDWRLPTTPVADPAAALARDGLLTSDWWSAPCGAGLLQSARVLGSLPVGLSLVEECTGDFEEAWVWGLEVDSAARVREITGAADWAALVAEYPAVVDGHREWQTMTGRAGRWTLPDWRAIAQDWDGVHLTVSGYLSAASRVLELGDGTATMIAGFNPDHTFWLRDVVRVDPAPVHWREREVGDDYVWEPAP